VRLSPILYTRSPTAATIIVAARHAAPATCTPRDKKTRFSKRNKEKGKQLKCSRFEFKPRQVNYSLQLNQETDHLVSQSPFVFRAVSDLARLLPMADLVVLLDILGVELRSHLAMLRTELGGLINRAGGEEVQGGAS
jgi:hypothetical protein